MMSSRRRSHHAKRERVRSAKEQKKNVEDDEDDETVDIEDEDPPYPPEEEIEIPDLLQQQLKDDCVHITRLNHLVSLPRKPSVCDVLLQYHAACVEDRNPELNVPLLGEALDGLKTYFDVTLHDHLLYEVERKQFSRLAEMHAVHSTPDAPDASLVNGFVEPPPSLEGKLLVPSEVYGPEHLLRLFVKLPLFLSRARVPSKTLTILHSYFKDLLQYMETHCKDFFSAEVYEDTGHVTPGEPAPEVPKPSSPSTTAN